MHKAKALAIHCIDLRFQKKIDEDIKKRGLEEHFDRISWPGTSKDLKNVKAAAAVSIKLHDPDEVIVYEHKDCGAYGIDNSVKTHQNNARLLAKELQKIKPSLIITSLIVTFEGIKNL